ncbi:hypothetical protein HCN44_009648 [Aphidius gifuensis]|uniref:Uncharacterized protein n=1 Tax=Aphidius gifuensis TaxID=684658 RepID=A0A834Y2M5_APHGI|nr:uncharacterized protein LOC122860434 [Aphidius gifuensis]XP_044020185.1 uncharacterized protein LOC122860434 [Aphidius gifuensis]KAF7998250.1 hypothetical protein HCN44_009648 [Aphidius gifuensis]
MQLVSSSSIFVQLFASIHIVVLVFCIFNNVHLTSATSLEHDVSQGVIETIDPINRIDDSDDDDEDSSEEKLCVSCDLMTDSLNTLKILMNKLEDVSKKYCSATFSTIERKSSDTRSRGSRAMTNLEDNDEEEYPQVRWKSRDFMRGQHGTIFRDMYSPPPPPRNPRTFPRFLPPRDAGIDERYHSKQRMLSPPNNQYLIKKLPHHSQSSPVYYYKFDEPNKFIAPPPSSSLLLSSRPLIYQQLVAQQNSPLKNGHYVTPAGLNNERVLMCPTKNAAKKKHRISQMKHKISQMKNSKKKNSRGHKYKKTKEIQKSNSVSNSNININNNSNGPDIHKTTTEKISSHSSETFFTDNSTNFDIDDSLSFK